MSRSKLAETWHLLQHLMATEQLKLRYLYLFKAILVAMAVTPAVALLSIMLLRDSSIVFPQVLEWIGAFLLVLGSFSAPLLTATMLGSEFEQGTAQVIVARGIPRWMLIVGKGGILIAAIALGALAGWFSGSIAAVVGHISQAGTRILLFGILALCTSGLDAVAVVVLAAFAYAGITMAIAVLTRSTAFTTFGGLGLVMGDLLVNGNLGVGFELGQWSTFSIFHNTVALLSKLQFTMAPTSLLASGKFSTPSATAVIVLLCYALGGLAAAILLFQRQDINN